MATPNSSTTYSPILIRSSPQIEYQRQETFMQKMARRVLLVIALILFAVMGISSASSDAAAPVANTGDAPDPFDETVVGNSAGGLDAAPVGGPVSIGTFPDIPTAVTPAPSPDSGAIALEAATVVGVVAAVAGSFLF